MKKFQVTVYWGTDSKGYEFQEKMTPTDSFEKAMLQVKRVTDERAILNGITISDHIQILQLLNDTLSFHKVPYYSPIFLFGKEEVYFIIQKIEEPKSVWNNNWDEMPVGVLIKVKERNGSIRRIIIYYVNKVKHIHYLDDRISSSFDTSIESWTTDLNAN